MELKGTARHAGDADPSAAATGNTAARGVVTTVRTVFHSGAKNYRLLFGVPLRTHTVTRAEGYTAAVAHFAPGARFALDLWRRNSYGTIQWRCFVCEAIRVGEEGEVVPFVTPAARVLLQTKGAAQSRLFLAWLTELEMGGIDPILCPSATFEAAHFRLQGSRADTTPARRLRGEP